jgi:hypothetical protein
MTFVKARLANGTFGFTSWGVGGTYTYMDSWTAARDDDTMLSSSAGGSGHYGFVVKHAGLYVAYFIAQSSGASGSKNCAMRIMKNGASLGGNYDISGSMGAGRGAFGLSWSGTLAVSDYIQLMGYTDAGQTLSFTDFAVCWLSGAT